MFRTVRKVLLACTPLTIGGLLYLGYRNTNLLIFRWANFLGLSRIVNSWRKFCFQYPLPEWCYYALPDGLWLLSYILLIYIIWDSHTWKSIIWIYALPTIAITSELIQLVDSRFGTFDIMDVICYMGAILLFELKTKIEWKRKDI